MNTNRIRFKELIEKTYIKNYDKSENRKGQLNELVNLLKEITPSKLYKYQKFNENTFSSLKNFIIKPSTPHFFNDPYDCQIFIDKNEIFESIKNQNFKWHMAKWLELNPQFENLLNKEQKQLLNDAFNQSNDNLSLTFKLFIPTFSKMIDETILYSLKYIKETTKISCFSEDIKSPLMWAHYTDSHKGFALEYDFTSYLTPCIKCKNKCKKEHYESIFPVIYSNERYNAKTFISEFLLSSFMKKFSNNLFIPNDDELDIYKIFLYKSLDWEYEKEWRFISLCQNHPGIQVKPTAIYLGCKIDKKNKNQLIKFAKENNISIYEMEMNFFKKEYSFEYKEI